MPASVPGLIDILPPPAPPPGPATLLAGLAGLLVVAVILAYVLRRHFGRRARCRRALARLQRHSRDLPPGSASARQQACYIARLLRFALGLHRLDAHAPLPPRLGPRQAHWQAFVVRLNQACYTPDPPTPATLAALCGEASDWIRQWT